MSHYKCRFISVPALIVRVIAVEAYKKVKWTELDKHGEYINELLYMGFTSSIREDRDSDYIYIDMDHPITVDEAKNFVDSYNTMYRKHHLNPIAQDNILAHSLEFLFSVLFPDSNPSAYIPPKNVAITPQDFLSSGDEETYDEYVYSKIAAQSSPRYRKIISRRQKGVKKPREPQIKEDNDETLQCKLQGEISPVRDNTLPGITLERQRQLNKEVASQQNQEYISKMRTITENCIIEATPKLFEFLKQNCSPVGYSEKLKMHYVTMPGDNYITWIKLKG